MGNQQSKSNNSDSNSNPVKLNLLDTLDVIASDIILTSEFNHMKNAFDHEHCNKLIVMTSRVLNKKFNHKQLVDIDKRIVQGNNTNTVIGSNVSSDTVVFTTHEKLQQLDTKDKTNKIKLCKRIAAFYCRIFMLYDAILKTINPVYIYRDYTTLQIKPYLKKDEIPERYLDDAKLWSNSFCMRRLYRFILEYKDFMNGSDNVKKNDNKNVNPVKRLMNVGLKCSSKYTQDGDEKTIIDENGIPELKSLYYDIFNFDTNTYDYMSEESKLQYVNDLSLFYKVFTGKDKPDDVNYFKDIPLYDYCKVDHTITEQTNVETKNSMKIYETQSDNAQFSEYASSLVEYVKESKRYETKLMEVLNIIFIQNEENQYIIHPDLNIHTLENLISQVRSIVTNMYVTCESNFKKIVSILNIIASDRVYTTEIQRRSNLQREKDKLLTTN